MPGTPRGAKTRVRGTQVRFYVFQVCVIINLCIGGPLITKSSSGNNYEQVGNIINEKLIFILFSDILILKELSVGALAVPYHMHLEYMSGEEK